MRDYVLNVKNPGDKKSTRVRIRVKGKATVKAFKKVKHGCRSKAVLKRAGLLDVPMQVVDQL